MSDFIHTHQTEGKLHLQINRPEKKNALTFAMYRALGEGLQKAREDDDILVVTLSGVEDCFCAGNDLGDFLNIGNGADVGGTSLFLQELINFPKPIVACVNGLTIGVGVTLLLHCDLVYASDTARFRLPFVNLGLVPEAGSSFLLPQMIGARKASELLLLGEYFDAHTAAKFGVINGVIAASELETHVQTIADKLVAQPPEAIKETKALLKRPYQSDFEEHLAHESALFAQRLGSKEAISSMQAFMNK